MRLRLVLSLSALAAASTLPAQRERAVDSAFAAFDRTTSPGCALGVY